jgi:hypothetical protein
MESMEQTPMVMVLPAVPAEVRIARTQMMVLSILWSTMPMPDGDGYRNLYLSIERCEQPLGFVSNSSDCNDLHAGVYPDAEELCDGIDNNCDGEIDDDLLQIFYVDADGDGHGNGDYSIEACTQPSGYVEAADDCDDGNRWAHDSDASEICDALDNNCNGQIDEGVTQAYYADEDQDGYGDQGNSLSACSLPEGYVSDSSDCDDRSDQAQHLDTPELCDGIDNNCDGQIDESVTTTYYLDLDGDGYGLESFTQEACSLPHGYSTLYGDCNEYNNAVHLDALEVCDGIDNDCDGDIDGGLTTTYYADIDGDGYGNGALGIEACTLPIGYVSDSSDCDDENAFAHDAAAVETCDHYDNNCDGQIDEGVQNTYYLDLDGDGYSLGTVQILGCSLPQGYTSVLGDCDDLLPEINPEAIEVCDEMDNDCDGDIDGGLTTRFYADYDEDGFGDDNVYKDTCTQPLAHIAQAGDCDDLKDWVYHGAPEICDGVDNNCDGLSDDADPTVDLSTGKLYYADTDGDGYGRQYNGDRM